MTVGIAVLLFIVLPHNVQKSRWFTPEQKILSRLRLEQDSQDEKKGFLWTDVRKALKSWQTWAFAFMPLMYGVGVASSSNFLPVSTYSHFKRRNFRYCNSANSDVRLLSSE